MAGKRSADIALGARPRLNAETSLEPDGLTRRVVLNILEAFFRRPWLYLLPLLLMTGLGVASVLGSDQEFRSVGTINASSNTLLEDLTQAAQSPGYTWETPAAVTSRNVNELLRTREFLLIVAEEAGLTDAVTQSPVLLEDIRRWTSASADGDFLVRIAATTPDPELSERLASSTLTSYTNWVAESDVSESTAAETFLQQKVSEAEQDVTDARLALTTYISENGATDLADIPLDTQLEVERLQIIVERAETRYANLLDQQQEASVAASQARTVVEQRLRVVDAPEVPLAAEPRLKRMALTIGMFAAIGLILSGALLLLAATLDRTIRIPNDITAKFGLEVLAVVPDTRR